MQDRAGGRGNGTALAHVRRLCAADQGMAIPERSGCILESGSDLVGG